MDGEDGLSGKRTTGRKAGNGAGAAVAAVVGAGPEERGGDVDGSGVRIRGRKPTKRQLGAIEAIIAAGGRRVGVSDQSDAEFADSNYGRYADSVIRDRAVPTPGSGLKPVQKRILHALQAAGLTPTARRSKTATAAGGVLAWHPHGDTSVVDAMYTLAQPFKTRVPLIDTQGSVGLYWGDEPAAPRYTEARLSPAGWEMIREVREGACEMRPNHDETRDEPVEAPAGFDNAVINGTSGIAVGYAVKTPCHNPTEVTAANLLLLEDPGADVDEVMRVMPGPDMPTGGVVHDPGGAGIRSYYTTGRGRFTMRGRFAIEPADRGKHRIVFTELPYGVSAEMVIQAINDRSEDQQAKGRGKGKSAVIPAVREFARGIASAADLTDKEHGLRLVITTARGFDPGAVVDRLFELTPAQTVFSVNNVMLVDGAPRQVGTIEMMRMFLDHRRECVTRRTRARMGAVDKRLAQLDAITAVTVDIDRAVAIIRSSRDAAEARKALVAGFGITGDQADYILAMRLQRLTRADKRGVEAEAKALRVEKRDLECVLAGGRALDEEVARGIREAGEVIADPRRTDIDYDYPPSFANARRSGGAGAAIGGAVAGTGKERAGAPAGVAAPGIGVPTDDQGRAWATRLEDRDGSSWLHVGASPFSPSGRTASRKHGRVIEAFRIPSDLVEKDVPLVLVNDRGQGFKAPLSYFNTGKPVRPESLGVGFTGRLVGVGAVDHDPGALGLLLFTEKGGVKRVRPDYPLRATGVPVVSLDDGDRIVGARTVLDPSAGAGEWDVLSVARSGAVLRQCAGAIRASGCRAGAIAGMRLAEEAAPGIPDAVIAVSLAPSEEGGAGTGGAVECAVGAGPDAVLLTTAGAGQGLEVVKLTPVSEFPVKGRGTGGVASQRFRVKENMGLARAVFLTAGEASSVEDGNGQPVAPTPRGRAAGSPAPEGAAELPV